ncbi:MAG: pilus assembly protein [Chloroflexi bacterium]|nr:pilus assembly protein [Chloroflexota bacterium]
MLALWQWLLSLRDQVRENRGQGLVEYALILILVAMVVIVVLMLFGPSLSEIFANVIDRL